eukprot:1160459-Pelagomonas_calceolata.AAC.11
MHEGQGCLEALAMLITTRDKASNSFLSPLFFPQRAKLPGDPDADDDVAMTDAEACAHITAAIGEALHTLRAAPGYEVSQAGYEVFQALQCANAPGCKLCRLASMHMPPPCCKLCRLAYMHMPPPCCKLCCLAPAFCNAKQQHSFKMCCQTFVHAPPHGDLLQTFVHAPPYGDLLQTFVHAPPHGDLLQTFVHAPPHGDLLHTLLTQRHSIAWIIFDWWSSMVSGSAGQEVPIQHAMQPMSGMMYAHAMVAPSK